jgi:hypothetical protein
MAKEKVIIRRAAGYDTFRIQGIIEEGLKELGLENKARGRLKAGIKRKIGRCPPKHKDIVLGFFIFGGILNPIFRLDLIYDPYVCLFFSWRRRLLTGRL